MGARAMTNTLGVRIKADAENELYRAYAAECLRMISENTAKMSQGSYMTVKFTELLQKDKTDTRCAEEIVQDVIKGAGIEVI